MRDQGRNREIVADRMVTKGKFLRSPETKSKRSKNAFAFTSIALTLVPLGTELLEISAQFLIGSPGTLGERLETEDGRDTSLPWKGNSRSYQILKK